MREHIVIVMHQPIPYPSVPPDLPKNKKNQQKQRPENKITPIDIQVRKTNTKKKHFPIRTKKQKPTHYYPATQLPQVEFHPRTCPSSPAPDQSWGIW